MTDWLLDIADKYLNRTRVYFVCRGMLYLVAIPLLLVVLLIMYQTRESKDIANIIIQTVQLLYDLGLAILCLALMRLLYEDNYKMPTIGYYAVILTIKGVHQFFMTNNSGGGDLYMLIFTLVLILHTVVGVQLLKTRFAVFGKAFLFYLGGIILSAIFSASHADMFSAIVLISALGVLAFTFYKELPLYYE